MLLDLPEISSMIPKLVSVIIPCYNYGTFLPETLEGLLAQHYTHWECVVVDDGSIDDTAFVVQRYAEKDSRFRYIYQPNQGQSPARNNGIRNSGGDYIQFLDADDCLQPTKLSAQVSFLEQNPSIDLVYGNVLYFSNKEKNDLHISRSSDQQPALPLLSGGFDELSLPFVQRNIIELGALLFKKSVLKEVGYFDESIQGVEDWDYCLRCVFEGKLFRYLHAENGYLLMRHHPNSFAKNQEKMSIEELKLRYKINRIVTKKGWLTLKSVNDERIQNLESLSAYTEIYEGNPLTGWFKLFQIAFKSNSFATYLKHGAYWFRRRIVNR